MSAPVHRDPQEVAAELHRRGRARVYDLRRHEQLVVFTPGRLLVSKLAWTVGGGVTAWFGGAAVLIGTELAVAAGWVMLALPAVLALSVAAWWGRQIAVEFAARDTMRRRDRGVQARESYARVMADGDDGGWGDVTGPVVSEPQPPGFGTVTRQQAALPTRDRSLPASSRRELR